MTPEAYLYASEFTSESTRKLQQQRLSEYADDLGGQLTLANLNNAPVTPQDTACAGCSASRTIQESTA